MATYKGFNKEYILDDNYLAKGGEGAIYNIKNRRGKLAKIYDRASKTSSQMTELEEKLTYMFKNPPSKEILGSIAWPLDLLYNDAGDFEGFVMPKMDTDMELGEIYKYNPTRAPKLNYAQRVTIATNICIVIEAVHNAGYVFGDFNPCNIGVNTSNGHVGFFDTDSYHITDNANGKTYRCEVCLDGYAAPELIEKFKTSNETYASAPLPTFTIATDRFALAIHIFKLLMNGYTPFNGILKNEIISQASPGVGNDAILRDSYCFKKGNKPQSVATPEYSLFPPYVRTLFDRAFTDGRRNPENRPSASEWENALLLYARDIVPCAKNISHYYSKDSAACPYCLADDRYSRLNGVPIMQMSYSRTTPPPVSPAPPKTTGAKKTAAKKPAGNSAALNSAKASETVIGKLKIFAKKNARLIKIVLIIIAIIILISAIDNAVTYSPERVKINLTSKTYDVLKNKYLFEFDVKNSGSEDISQFIGIMRLKDDDDIVHRKIEIRFRENISSGETIRSQVIYNPENDNGFITSKLEDMVVTFQITGIAFKDGTVKYFNNADEVRIN